MIGARSDEHAGKVEVPVTTLDKIVEELRLPRVDFIKMDIEGAEREALRGASVDRPGRAAYASGFRN